jgi:H+/Cl- antiporter ClcA
MVMLDTLTPLTTLGMGAGLVLISGKFWVFTMSAIAVISEAQLGQSSSIIAFLLYVLLAQSLLLLIILVRLIFPGQSKSILESISAWLTRYNRPIVITVSFVFGLLFLFQGVSGLLQ